MEFVTVRDLRSTPRQVWQALERDGMTVVTNHGRPQALMVSVNGQTLDATAQAVRRAQLIRLVAQQQAASVAAGLDTLTMAEIDAEIAAARQERHAQSTQA
ncbi:MAG: hypothetical protein LBR19_00030 [Bifidobacteriaceae bacterium]|jgi:antitoxin (DNA-binding transcriptional repressor) of toxin-antitoxin stability system|nr:hypothetical protein [Bifidobacteriaceae bacterium]